MMQQYLDAFISAFEGTVNYTWKSIVFEVPLYKNFFWGLVAISLLVWILEILFPWRKEQSIFRKDFWLDAFYMFFNFFIFSIVIAGVYKILGIVFGQLGVTAESIALINTSSWPVWAELLLFFVLLFLSRKVYCGACRARRIFTTFLKDYLRQ